MIQRLFKLSTLEKNSPYQPKCCYREEGIRCETEAGYKLGNSERVKIKNEQRLNERFQFFGILILGLSHNYFYLCEEHFPIVKEVLDA